MDSKELFSDRVDVYASARPSYAEEAVRWLAETCGIGPSTVVADFGCGTGIFAEQLLRLGASVFGIEPNAPMRDEAARSLGSGFTPIVGSAERSSIADGAVDLVTAAQSFHWFDPLAARTEFLRVLRPPGWVALLWNVRQSDGGGAADAYDAVLQEWAPEYRGSGHGQGEAELKDFFHPAKYVKKEFANDHALDWTTYRDRAYSASYFPRVGTSARTSATEALKGVFDRHQHDDKVVMAYTTEVYVGKIG
ncbi:MAG: class I SAM-dependent methyltransferase [Armatimonadetes bacterium]|nr:class I SAM-dependent methyltransferase [Armatimonadota bacterium]